MIKLRLKLLVAVMLLASVVAQAQKEVTVADLYLYGTFRQKGVYGIESMKDGETYTNLNMMQNEIIKYSYKTGKEIETLLSVKSYITDKEAFDYITDYTFSADETKILFSTLYEPIYRHSFLAEYYIFDLNTKKMTRLSENGKQQLASFSPDGKKVAFVRKNNLYVKDIDKPNSPEIQLTTDGEWNKIINGAPDWVYEEEFSYNKAYDWSADGKKIAFLRTDESNVKMFGMTMYGELYPETYEYKYPKAGEENSKVSLRIVDVESKKTVVADMGNLDDQYIPRLKFTNDANVLSAVKLNRLQNKYELFLINATDGSSKVVQTLNDKKYIEINDDLTFLPGNKGFITSHESNGFRHIYMYDINGQLIRQLTDGAWEVTEFYGIDDKENVYFQAAKKSPMQREVYVVDSKGKITELSHNEGTNSANFSSGCKYFINNYSNANTPSIITLCDNKGKLIRELENNEYLSNQIGSTYKFAKKEFFSFKNEEGVELNGWMIKPQNFDATKKYPVFMYVYGGPGSQTVADSWDYSMPWYQIFAQHGYIVVSVDNRGTGYRGRDFRQTTYGQLGKYEVQDQISAAKYLGTLGYVDKDRIGIFGWSYGGYMSSLCMTIGADYFKMGIAVAPVTTWRYYDSVYTERYNGLPKDNASGYDDNSPINHAKKMKGKYLLVHGTADDNVHFQNSVDWVTKLIDANVQFDLMYYPNKDHSIYGGNTRYHLYTKLTNYVLTNL
ncbi:MAG: S9 family peptidase [Bacteroidales bacterium]|nr:S9 family peptidase [Bacteroidales bacterium]